MTARQRPLVPTWLDRLAAIAWRLLVVVALGLVAVAIAIQLSTTTASILVALLVSATLAPWVIRLRARGWSRARAAAAVSLGALVVIGGVVTILVLAIVPNLLRLREEIDDGIATLREWLVSIGAPDELSVIVDRLADAFRDLVSAGPTLLIGPLASVVTVAVLAGFLTFFLLLDGDRAWAWSMSFVTPWRREMVTASGRDGLDRVGAYVGRTAILAALDAIVAAVALVVLGVPLVGPLTALVFAAGFVPYLGAIASTTLLALVTLATAGSSAAIGLVVVMVLANVVQGRLLERTRYGAAGDVDPIVLLIAIPAGAVLFGALGLFAVLPAVVFVLAVSGSVRLALELGPEPTSTPPGAVPVWLDRLAQWSWRALAVVALAGLVVLAIDRLALVAIPVILALILACTLLPVVEALERRGWPRRLGAAATTIGAGSAIAIVIVMTAVATIDQLGEIVDLSSEGAGEIDIGGIGVDIGAALASLVAAIGSAVLDDVGAVLGDLLRFAFALILSTLLTFFFLRDGPRWWDRATTRLDLQRRDPIVRAGGEAVDVLGGYMVGTAIISAFGGVTSWFIMAVLGLPLAVPIGVLTFFGGFIPYIGSFVTTALAFLVAVAVGDLTDIVVMAVFTVVFNIVQGNFVTPLVYGRTLSLHPAVILVAIPAGNELAGILGMFLVVPFVAVVSATWRTLFEAIDDRPVREPRSDVPPDGSPAEAPPAPAAPEVAPELG